MTDKMGLHDIRHDVGLG